MLKVFIILLNVFIFGTYSLAQGSDRIDSEHLKLLGRGFQNTRTDDVIFLLCTDSHTDETCDAAQFAVFTAKTHEISILGDPIGASSPDLNRSEGQDRSLLLKQKVKEKIKAFNQWRKYHFDMHGNEILKKDRASTLTWCFTLGGFFTALGVGTAGTAWVVGIAALPFYFGMTQILNGNSRLTNGTRTADIASVDRSQWNWSTRPVRVSSKVFESFIQYMSEKSVN